MFALIVVSAVQAKVVRDGSLEDPAWEPWPSGDIAQAESDEEYQSAITRRDRRAATKPFVQDVGASTWSRYARTIGILVHGDDRGGQVVGVANAQSGVRSSIRGVRSLKVGPWIRFDEPVPLRELVAAIEERFRDDLIRTLRTAESRPLPSGMEQAVRAALLKLIGPIERYTDQLPPFDRPERTLADVIASTDANQTALRLFSRSWRDLEPTRVGVEPSTTSLPARLEALARVREQEAITDDTTAFLDWTIVGPARRGWLEFVEGERRLLVKNINFMPPETATGADLVYVSQDPDTVVLVQYKVLADESWSTEPLFRDSDGRLGRQVDTMLAHCGDIIDRGTREIDARVGSDFAFVKFIDPVPSHTIPAGRLPAGRYLPADAVRRMLLNPETGPRGGAVHFVHRRRYLDGEVFARLVRDRWVGSGVEATTILAELLELGPSTLTLAVDQPT